MMFEEVAPPDTATDLHLHRDSNEIAYVLAGEITFNIGGETWVGGPGACAFMPRGVPHAWKSTGKEPGRALCLYAPGRAGRFFEEVTELAPIAPEQIHAVIGTLVQRYGWESVGPSPF
jgi:quercetin dioxygenase-like cupin family protein